MTAHLRVRVRLPLIEDLRQIEVRRNQTDVAVTPQDPHDARWYASRHVVRLCDGWNEMIVFRRQEQRRLAPTCRSGR